MEDSYVTATHPALNSVCSYTLGGYRHAKKKRGGGRAGPGSGSRGWEQGGRVAWRIAPHRARAGQRAGVRKRRRENSSMLNTDLMHG